MRYRHDFGDPQWQRPGEHERGGFTASRHWNRDEDMGGSDWSGASGRGGMGYDERACRGFGATNEGYGGRGSFWMHEPHRFESEHERAYRLGHFGPPHFGPPHFGPPHFGPPHDDDERGPFYRTGPKGYRRSDERIREDVCEVIAQQGYIDARDVEVHVEEGIVKLTGTIVRRHDKRVLEHMIDGVRGVEEIHNNLRLRREDREHERDEGNEPPRSHPPNGLRTRM